MTNQNQDPQNPLTCISQTGIWEIIVSPPAQFEKKAFVSIVLLINCVNKIVEEMFLKPLKRANIF